MTGSGKTPSGRTLWLDPGFGASGDMMLGTLIGLGASVETIRSGLQTLEIDGWTLAEETALRCSLSATRAVVGIEPTHDHSHDHSHSQEHGSHSHSHEHDQHRQWSTIDALLANSGLPAAAKQGARATFRRLGEVEAGIHNIDIDHVHFHEVGAVDAIVDIVGAWLALDSLGVTRVVSGPIGMGHGTVEAAHGRLPIPAPATAELLIGATIRSIDVAAETVTPTGAALLVTMTNQWGPMPQGSLAATARGAGGRDPEHYPNVLTGYLIEPSEATNANTNADEAEIAPAQQVDAVMLTTNLDDATPEIVGHTINRCLAAGADDAWASPIIMKKSRPGVELHVLCSPDLADRLRQLVFTETGTLGLRTETVTKHMLDRHFTEVTVHGQTIAIKVGPFGAKPEYEDLARASEALGVPVRTLSAEALAAYFQATADKFRIEN